MIFPGEEVNISKKTEAIICFKLFSPPIFRLFLWKLFDKSSDFDKIKFEIQNQLKNVISKRRRLYVKKHKKYS